jgi:lysophospholipase L1-like esterase
MRNILCYGDSNTYGLSPEWLTGNPGRHAPDVRWPGALQKLLGDDYHIIEEGLNGRTTVFDDPTSFGRCGLDFLQICIESHLPLDLIILMLGTNDCRSLFGVSPAEIAAGMGRLVQTALNPFIYMMFPVPKILIAAPVPIGEAATRLPDGITTLESVEKSRRLAAQYEPLAKMMGCEFIDLGAAASASPDEGIHLTAEGHGAVARAMAAKIREIFE